MKRYRVGNANAYHLIGDKVEDREFIPTNGIFMQTGRTFVGQLVFIPMPIGFQPVIKVLDPRLSQSVYYALKDVEAISNDFNIDDKASNFLGSASDYNYATQYAGLKSYSYANVNVLPELDIYKDSYPQYASADGGFFGKLKYAIKDVVDKNKNEKELTKEQLEQLHKSSGSKMSLGEWLKSEQANKLANNALALGLALANNKGGSGGANSSIPTGKEAEEEDSNNSTTILGMHPITFGIVTVGVLVVGAITIILIKNNKN